MFSMAFRSCRVANLRIYANTVNIQHAPAAVVFRQHLSTETKNDGLNVQVKDSEWENVYKGALAPRIRNLKIVSFMTSGVGLFVQPLVLQKASEMGSSLVTTISVCTIAGFFTFITPILIHLVTKKYVTSIEYNEKEDEYSATVISFFLKPKKVNFKTFQVRLPLTPKLTVTFYVKKCPLFVDPQAFNDVIHYQRILGYDKPYEFVKEPVNVCKKTVVKPDDSN